LNKKGRTKRYAKSVELLGRLRERYPRASTLFEVDVVPDSERAKNKFATAKDSVGKKRTSYAEQSQLDGC
jgi:hypothetical protein